MHFSARKFKRLGAVKGLITNFILPGVVEECVKAVANGDGDDTRKIGPMGKKRKMVCRGMMLQLLMSITGNEINVCSDNSGDAGIMMVATMI